MHSMLQKKKNILVLMTLTVDEPTSILSMDLLSSSYSNLPQTALVNLEIIGNYELILICSLIKRVKEYNHSVLHLLFHSQVQYLNSFHFLFIFCNIQFGKFIEAQNQTVTVVFISIIFYCKFLPGLPL